MTGPKNFIQQIHVTDGPPQRDQNNRIPQLFCWISVELVTVSLAVRLQTPTICDLCHLN